MAVIKRAITTSNSIDKKKINIGYFTNLLEYEWGNALLNDILTTDDSVEDRIITATNTIAKKTLEHLLVFTNIMEYTLGEVPMGMSLMLSSKSINDRSITAGNTVTKRTITAS